MSKNSAPTASTARKGTLGDRIRTIADQLNQESAVQIKATSRILGAAAKISENHDRLIGEVVEMVEEDLTQQTQIQPTEPHTVEQLKQRFKTLSSAKAHFGLKVSSWAALATKLNNHTDGLKQTGSDDLNGSIACRLETIEQEIKSMRTEMEQVLRFLGAILKKI